MVLKEKKTFLDTFSPALDSSVWMLCHLYVPPVKGLLCEISNSKPWFFLRRDPKSRGFLAGLIESLHSALLAFALLHCQDQNKSCRPLCSPRVDLVSLKSSGLTPSHTLLCTLRQVNTHTLRAVAPGWFYIHDKEPSLWISKTHIWLAVGMTHTLGLSRSQQAAGRPTRSRRGRSQRRPSIRACRGQQLAAYISRPREHGLALLSGPFVLTLPYPCLGRSLTDPKNTRAPQYQSVAAERALGRALTAEDAATRVDFLCRKECWQSEKSERDRSQFIRRQNNIKI